MSNIGRVRSMPTGMPEDPRSERTRRLAKQRAHQMRKRLARYRDISPRARERRGRGVDL